LRTITQQELIQKFPKLNANNHARTSLATGRYNCLAFARADERKWWEPRPGGRYYWPPNARWDTSLATVTNIFLADGYAETKNRDVEPGYSKVAIYVDLEDVDSYSHVAVSNGICWKSKLGKGQDIAHNSLDLLEGDQVDEYGIVAIILRKAIQ
jgi:hypothetical protein